MDAVNFIKEKNRMCDSISRCDMCDLHGRTTTCREFVRDYPEEAVKIVEKWGNEHPVMTNGAKFEEVFGRTYMSLPSFVGEWLEQEYKEPKGE